MKKIEVSDEVYQALRSFSSDFEKDPSRVIGALLDRPEEALIGKKLSAFLGSPAFRALGSDADRYLAILGFVYKDHGPDFRDFVEHLSSRRKYFGASPEEIQETSRHNQARQIPNSPYWAIMNIDTATKRRFLRRAREFVGYPDEAIALATSHMGRQV